MPMGIPDKGPLSGHGDTIDVSNSTSEPLDFFYANGLIYSAVIALTTGNVY